MELRLICYIVLKRLGLILVLPVLAGIISAIASMYVLKPVYESWTTIYVINKSSNPEASIDYEDLLVNQQLVKDYRELVKSRSMLREVLEQLGITGLSPEELAKRVTVELKNDTRILQIKVLDTSPVRAKEIVDRISTAFINKVSTIMSMKNINIVDSAEVPAAPVKPQIWINIAGAAFTGLLVSLCIAVILETTNDTIRSREDVEKKLGLTVLGIIPMADIK